MSTAEKEEAVEKDIDEVVTEVLTNIQRFLWDLQQIVSKYRPNIIYSPINVAALLSVLKNGAEGHTEQDIQNILKLTTSREDTNRAFRHILHPLTAETWTLSSDSLQLKNISIIYKNQGAGLEFTEDFKMCSREFYLVGTEEIDFTNTENGAKQINDWISVVLNSKIKKAVTKGSVPGNLETETETGVILVNAVYVKISWEQKFLESKTKIENFYLSPKKTKSVLMMRHTFNYPYIHLRQQKAGVVEMQCSGGVYSMLVYLPDKSVPLSEVEKLMKGILIKDIRSHMVTHTLVAVKIPKFSIESSIPLVHTFTKIGLHSIFDPRSAEFNNLATSVDGKNVFVSEVVQKVSISCYETIPIADAVADVPVHQRNFPGRHLLKVRFTVDRPFMFQIVNRATNCILFAGRCSNPEL